jgi:hypothetical protein
MTDNTKNFLVSSSVNEVDQNAETTEAGERMFLMKTHGVELHLELDVEGFQGQIEGWAGGIGGVGNYEFSLLDN